MLAFSSGSGLGNGFDWGKILMERITTSDVGDKDFCGSWFIPQSAINEQTKKFITPPLDCSFPTVFANISSVKSEVRLSMVKIERFILLKQQSPRRTSSVARTPAGDLILFW